MSFSTPPKNLFDPALPSARPVADGILDGTESAPSSNVVQDEVAAVAINGTAARRLWTIAGTFAAIIASTYVIPGAERFQPWRAGEGYTPFWNIVGREFLGEGKAAQAQEDETERLVELAEEPALPEMAPRPGIKPAENMPAALAAVTSEPQAGPGSENPSADNPSADKAAPGSALPATADLASPEDAALEVSTATPVAVLPGEVNVKLSQAEDVQRAAEARSPGSVVTLPSVFPAYEPQPGELEAPKVKLEGEAGLKHYFHKLTRVQLGAQEVARAGMWGDSVLGNDGVTHALRRRMQVRFGDAGHGFIVVGRYNPAYFHQGVRFQDRGGWRRCEIIFHCEDDQRYGYGGATALSSGGGETWFSTVKQGVGSRVSRLELWYAKRKDGGKLQVKVDGQVKAMVSTLGAPEEEGIEVLPLSDDSHEIEVRAAGGGPAKAYGVVMERDAGVVWDSLGLIGSFTQRLDYQDADHLARQVALRRIDLLSFILGGNDVQREKMDLVHNTTRYEDEYTRVIRKFRKGRPQASCLVLSLVDHGERVGPREIRTRAIVPRLVQAQRKVALAEGCAFFDTFQAMGGDGSVARWYRATPPLVGADFAHPTQAGHEVIAALFHKSLMYAYAKYREEQLGQPLAQGE